MLGYFCKLIAMKAKYSRPYWRKQMWVTLINFITFIYVNFQSGGNCIFKQYSRLGLDG